MMDAFANLTKEQVYWKKFVVHFWVWCTSGWITLIFTQAYEIRFFSHESQAVYHSLQKSYYVQNIAEVQGPELTRCWK